MKNCLILFCLLIGSRLVFATSQTALNQDKPARLYIKNYIESAEGNINILEDGSGYLGYTERQNKRVDTFSENIQYQDGLAGTANYHGNENYNDSDASANRGSQFQMLCNKTISVSSGAGINYSAVPTTQITSGSDSLNGSGWDIYGNSSESIGSDIYSSTNNGYGMPGVRSEHCDVGTPIRDHSGSPSFHSFAAEAPPNWQEQYRRKSQTTIKLQTGGKATSKLRNLFALSASATKINPVHVNDGYGVYFSSFTYTYTYNGNAVGSYANVYTFYAPFDNPTASLVGSAQPTETSIPSQNISIGSYGNLLTNGVLYKVLPDNADVDVTPYAAGVDYYTFYVGQPQKYRSYFDLYVQQANPGYSFIFYSQTNDVGHAFWRFRTDASADALQYISSSLTGFLGQKWGFYPLNGLFTVPGILQNDNSHSYNISRTFYVGFPDLLQGLIYTKGISNAPPVYVLSAFNCVGAARGAGFAADVFGLPWDESPQNFGVTLMQMYPAPGQIVGPFIDTNDVFYSSAPY